MEKKIKYVNTVTHLGRIIDNGCGKKERHNDNVINRINKARGCYMRYQNTVWNNMFINIELKMRLFDSLVVSVLMYSMDTVPVKKSLLERLQTFIEGCYKRILKINKDVKIKENELIEILGRDPIEDTWRRKRLNAYSHIARLPYDNPARIVLYGKPTYKMNGRRRRFANVKRTMMKDINKIYDESTYCNLCDRRMRRITTHIRKDT